MHPDPASPEFSTEYEGGELTSPFINKALTEQSIEICKTSHNPCKLSFKNLNYEVEVKLNAEDAKRYNSSTKKLKIIKDISGCALPGQTLYIMGASGAGKTSLLNILSDRISTGNGA